MTAFRKWTFAFANSHFMPCPRKSQKQAEQPLELARTLFIFALIRVHLRTTAFEKNFSSAETGFSGTTLLV